MMIKLKGELDPELIGLGLMPGDIKVASPCPVSKVGVVHFAVHNHSGIPQLCSVWPENYDVYDPDGKGGQQ